MQTTDAAEADEDGQPLGATDFNTLNLGCGDKQERAAWNVDVSPDCDPDEVVDLSEFPWPWPDETFERILAFHVLEHLPDIERALRECERVLKSGGRLIAHVPIGLDADADPDHEWGQTGRPWTWRTPCFLCGQRHWDVDVGLEVADRNVRLWSMRPSGSLQSLQTAIWKWRLARKGPGPWCFGLPTAAGEFKVAFEKPDDEH